MNQDQIESLVRTLLKTLGTAAATKGWADGAHVELICGGVAALVGVLWSHFHHAVKPSEPVKP